MSNSQSHGPNGFDRFGLHKNLLRGVRAAGFTAPRPIQTETIPAGLSGQDVLGLAQTGTGKTAAFALPLLEKLLADRRHDHRNDRRGDRRQARRHDRRQSPRALVIAPTRELASQIAAEIRTLAQFTRLTTVTIFGGVSAFNQVRALERHPEIVVGCPGRVLDLLQQQVLRLDQVETLVLDEADHMFDMGFLPDIRKIMAPLPAQRQNLLFSATMPREVRRLADQLLKNPRVVELAVAAPATNIDHGLVLVAEQRKRALLEHVLTGDDCDSAIVFTRTKHRARRLAEQLCKAGHRAVGLQGNLSQSQRDRAMKGFRSRYYDILVATDIAARGIDVIGVSHVINYDVPNTPEAYTHRIGRTGRAECDGIATTFVTAGDHGWLRATENMIGAPIQRRRVAGFEPDTGPRKKIGGQPQRNRGYAAGRRRGRQRVS